MAKFQKGDGHGRNGGGRQKGTPNKVTKEKRELISAFIEKKWEDFEEAFNAIDRPETKCQVFVALLPFAVPKLQHIEYKGQTQIKTLADELDEISGEKTRQ